MTSDDKVSSSLALLAPGVSSSDGAADGPLLGTAVGTEDAGDPVGAAVGREKLGAWLGAAIGT